MKGIKRNARVKNDAEGITSSFDRLSTKIREKLDLIAADISQGIIKTSENFQQ
jgi:hypothetical protein